MAFSSRKRVGIGQKRRAGAASADLLTKNLALMPTTEVPGYNSLRVQKAYRINGIESGRLDKQIQILERQKLHTVRLVNNDIRLTRITLDHIEASSGKSVDVQGFLGNDGSSSVNTLNFAVEENEDKPMFLYGERKVSRRVGRFRRIQSAMVKGRNTQSGGAVTESSQRPKSSIPTFREIKARVHRQMEVNPDWDPNVELPEEEEETTDDRKGKIINAWMSEERLTSAATSAKTERNKSGKRTSVSWQLARTSPDGDSREQEAINQVEQENSSNTASDHSPSNLKDANRLAQRSKSASTLKTRNVSTLSPLNSAIEEESSDTKETQHDRKSVKSAKARLERTPAIPKPRNPRDHPMVKVVGKTRALIGQAKKAQCSTTFVDPEKSQLGTIMEKQMKKKAAKLAKRRDLQVVENISTENKVSEYLSSNPAVRGVVGESDALANYDQVRNVLIEKHISLKSTLKFGELQVENLR